MVALVGGPPEEIGQHVVVDVHGESHGGSACVDALVDTFGQHDDGEVGDRGGDLGDDRGVGDPEPADALDGADGVDDGPRVAGSAHRNRGGRVTVCGQIAGDDLR